MYIFHLGWPEISARYNAVGRFGRVSEVASRVAGQLSGEGNSAAFREFAWRFVNIIARALVALGERPDYMLIMRYVNNIADLYIRYAGKVIRERLPGLEQIIANNQSVLSEEDVPRTMQNQPDAVRIWSIEMALSSEEGKKYTIRFWMDCAVLSAMTVRILTKSWLPCCRYWKNSPPAGLQSCWRRTIWI